MLKSRLYFVFVFFICFAAKAQVNRYVIFFSDKDTAAFSTNNPEQFLSLKAIERREKQAIPITAQDFPVNNAYLNGLRDMGADVYFSTKWFNAALVQMDLSLVSPIFALEYVTDIEYVALDSLLGRVKQPFDIPEEFLEPPSISSNSDIQLNLLNAKKMHEDGFSGQGMLIAVFDVGFIGTNNFKPFQQIFDDNRLIAMRDFVGNTGNVFQYGSHGTSVFSCIGAKYKGDMVGTAPDADFVLCVTEAANEYRIEEYNWLLAAEYADSLGVDVINSSLGYSNGFTDPNMDYSLDDLDGKTTVISRAAQIASGKGIIIVTSAGNEGRETNTWRKITPPADAENILTVGSIDKYGVRSAFSSIGPTADGRIKPDVMAMGSNTAIMSSSGNIITGNGTSFASPLMAGFAACMWQANPDWNYLEVIDAIKNSASNALTPDSFVGYGLPNYNAAIHNSILSLNQLINTNISIFPNPFTGNKITIDFMGAAIDESMSIEISDAQGRQIYKQKVTKRNRPDQVEIEFDTDKSGVYLLSLKSRNVHKVIKLIKI
jgi:serine protease AprX